MLKEVFEHQAALAHRFHQIEADLGYPKPPGFPVDLNTREGQDRFRQYAWWITEELVEMNNAPSYRKMAEELADVFHFVVEIALMAGVTSHEVPEPIRHYQPITSAQVINSLGLAINMMKNKPWKRTTKEVNAEVFKKYIAEVVSFTMSMFYQVGLDPITMYFDKNAINQARIQAGE